MKKITATVADELGGKRLDQVLTEIFPDYSRNKLQTWIKSGRVSVNGKQLKPKDKLNGGEFVEMDAEPETVQQCAAEAIPLTIAFEDETLLIVNKPAGMVVHPAAGNWQGTLQNALMYYHPPLAILPRAGIVHRIDKDTSGLLMIAKTLQSHHSLVEQLQARTIDREYLAVTQKRMTAGGTIDEPIGRHPIDRKRFAVIRHGKNAVTHYRVVERYNQFTLIRVKLETGRTHQIRVHLAHVNYPLLGDPVYGGRFKLPSNCPQQLEIILRQFKRQALHAGKLGLIHPTTGEYSHWEVELPADMQQLVDALKTMNADHTNQ